MFPGRECRASGLASFPRIRGDVPHSECLAYGNRMFSPHTRGCSSCLILLIPKKLVFPAYAGMFLPAKPSSVACGSFSPHTRGCSALQQARGFMREVFPAHAGMFLSRISVILRPSCFPRVCGDVPHQPRSGGKRCRFSPHTRGCSAHCPVGVLAGTVFPAYAGMFLRRAASSGCASSFPRIRGEVPLQAVMSAHLTSFSPHTRGSSSIPRVVKTRI